MAAPEGVTPVYNEIVISVYGGGVGFGIVSNTPGVLVGTVYKIGANVYNISVGQKVGFKTQSLFSTLAGDSFATAEKRDVYITYTDSPPS